MKGSATNVHKKKILILCDIFPPAFAPRMGYLCKYLQDSEWEPIVVTETVPGNMFAFLTGECKATFITFYQTNGTWSSKLNWMKTFIADLLFDYKNRVMIKTAEKFIKENSFELILCSTYRTYPLPAALKLSQKYHLPLIVDNRDIIEQYPKEEFIGHQLPHLFGLEKVFASFFRWKLLKNRNKVLRVANCITTVSPWHVECLKRYNPNVQLIYNGFAPELFYPKHIPSQQFRITFTGRLVSLAMGNPGMLFSAIQKLADDKIFTPKECRVDWYTDESTEKIIRQEAAKFISVNDFQNYHRFLPANEIPDILHQSSVLLIMCNKSSGTRMKGIMGTKFFESLGVEKPILCVQSDEDCLEATIKETQAGVAARTEQDVYDFLLETYSQWKEQGFTSVSVRKNVINKYSRKEQAKQFIQLFNTFAKNNG
ncbi:hypothetical protein [Parabacteroides bouchesdurhonensis]|uniref:hypothetical protein n=1 Tax=Parabacteroides bouchesdurhonensis TaxID=1936995 RepID=UPI000C824C2B|nr:hypothetical protein [Parabacteroides bouchesdurhonensis]